MSRIRRMDFAFRYRRECGNRRRLLTYLRNSRRTSEWRNVLLGELLIGTFFMSIDYSNNYVFNDQFNYEVKAIIQDYKSIERVNAEKQLNYEMEMDLKYSGVTKKEIFTAAENLRSCKSNHADL